MTLRELISDCGGMPQVAKAIGRSTQSVHEWVQQGRLPFSDLKGETDYSEQLARMQKKGSLTAVEIRRIGLRL